MRQRLEQWLGLSRWERRLLLQSLLLLPVIGSAVQLAGFRKTCALLQRLAPARPHQPPGYAAGSADSAQRVARLVGVAARRGPYRARCLVQSLATWGLLRRRGIPARLRIGVCKLDTVLQAHAWVEYCGEPLGHWTPGYVALPDTCPPTRTL